MAGSHKEVYLTHGRGELCSPAGDLRVWCGKIVYRM